MVSVSSWYTPAGRFAEMDDLTRPGQYQHHGPDPAANMAAITLAGVAGRATVPLLQVYGGNDPGSPPSHAERIAAEYGGPVTTVVYPDGVHILNNLWNRRPAAHRRLARRHPARSAMADYPKAEAKQAARERFTGLWAATTTPFDTGRGHWTRPRCGGTWTGSPATSAWTGSSAAG